ncbi:uncharacterized protein LOC117618520 isoform X4 [Prunus dulcis]|uniref:uncharacterized protein LOC117618520 isoform X4 n=1 Tax=Prunus dulcis TaxID=3755 RepID=UPI001483CD0C|nr:uncharacterized protein LOC117618520 isoform X4 [Prunus dulcis]
MVEGLVPAGAIVVDVLSKDNYEHWSALVKNYLLAQDLWDVVEATAEPPVPEEADQLIGRKKTAAALHAIQISCGPDAFSVIKEISSSKIAWDILAQTFKPQRWRSVQSANSSNNPDENNDLRRFFAAVKIGDWEETNNILRGNPNAIRARSSTGETALHIATKLGDENMVEKLVDLMTAEDLEIQDFGWTALHLAARLSLKMVKCMVGRNMNLNLLGMVEESHGLTPILFAAKNDLWDIVHYLYPLTPIEDLMPENGPYGAGLVCFCFYAKQFGIHIQPPAIPDVSVNVQNPEIELGSQRNISFSGINHICEMKLIHDRSLYILDHMVNKAVKDVDIQEREDGLVYEAVFQAVRRGIIEFVIRLCKVDPDVLWRNNSMGRNIFHYSIECRQEKVYSLIYGVRQRNLISTFSDAFGNDMLHLAGMLSPTEKLDRISGAALQMQRERQWFKEVKSTVVLPSGVRAFNKEGKRPHELFTQNHKKLKEEGEKWMKDAATSCTVVGALTITIMFAAAFTVPGGNNGGTGFPIFLHKKMFMVFIVSDAISLFSSITSVLMFLGILTSRYAEDDFLKSLPTKMIIGLSTLLISIATMMVAFCSALILMLHERLQIVIPIIFLASIPVALFIGMQFALLREIFISTYGGGIFDKKVKRWI